MRTSIGFLRKFLGALSALAMLFAASELVSCSSDSSSGDSGGGSLTVTVTPDSSEIASDRSTVLKATASGGNTTLTYKWSITSGGAYATISSETGAETTLTGKNTTSSDQTVTVRCYIADSDGNTGSGTAEIKVKKPEEKIDTTKTLTKTETVYSNPKITISKNECETGDEVTISAAIPDAKVTKTYSDGTTDSSTEKVVAEISWSGATVTNGTVDTRVAGNYIITASYTIGGKTYTSESVTLTVTEKSTKTLTKTETVYSNPKITISKNECETGDEVTISAAIPDAKVTKTYSDGTTDSSTEKVVAEISWSGATVTNGTVDTSTAGNYTITASYTIGGKTYTSESVTLTVKISSGFSFTFLNGDSDISVSCTENGSGSYKFTATPTSSSATYAWYVDLKPQSETSSTLTTTISDSRKHAVLVTATDSETGVVYSAQYTLTVSN